jgi:hypothetical protein
MSFNREAFNRICTEAVTCDSRWYVVLIERSQFYGGPEEGGWWGTDTEVIAYQEYPSEELAHRAQGAIEQLARELSIGERRKYGEQCLRELEWLEARGLDADYLPEPDGPTDYVVRVTNEIPQSSLGCRHYE